jgi:hypothetical protein
VTKFANGKDAFLKDGVLAFGDEDCERFIPVRIAKMPGTKLPWQGKLIGPSGAQRDLYLNKVSQRLKTDANGNRTLKDNNGIEADLLVGLLISDTDGAAMDYETIRQLPSHIQETLYTVAREMGAIGKEAEDKAGEN